MQTLRINMNHDPVQLNFSCQTMTNDLKVIRPFQIIQLAIRRGIVLSKGMQYIGSSSRAKVLLLGAKDISQELRQKYLCI